jgi:VanZ family protein
MLIINLINKYYKSITFAVFITVISLIRFKTSPGAGIFNIPYMDKIVHFFLYGILCFLLLRDTARNPGLKSYFVIIILCLSFGGIIELIQISQPGRSGEFLDLAANFAGSIFAIPVYSIYNKIR